MDIMGRSTVCNQHPKMLKYRRGEKTLWRAERFAKDLPESLVLIIPLTTRGITGRKLWGGIHGRSSHVIPAMTCRCELKANGQFGATLRTRCLGGSHQGLWVAVFSRWQPSIMQKNTVRSTQKRKKKLGCGHCWREWDVS